VPSIGLAVPAENGSHTGTSPIDVSVIVIGHNVRDEVHTALKSIEENRGELAVETILVDNGSTDGTAESVAEAFPRAQVIRLGSNEAGAGRNHGLRIARGRYRMFLDSDAQLTSGTLDELVRFLDEHPEVGLVGPRVVYPDGSIQYTARRHPPLLLPLLRRPPFSRFFEDGRRVRRYLMMDSDLDHAREVEYVISACALFSAEAQRAAGEIDPWILFPWEDADYCLQIRAAGYKIAYNPTATAIHTYRRITAKKPLSAASLRHLVGFVRLRLKWRRERRRLIEEGRLMDSREGRTTFPAGAAARAPAAAAAALAEQQ
jgi:GT2 family glycosyltransferase